MVKCTHTHLHVVQGKHRLPATTVSVVLDKTPQECHAYNFWFKSVISAAPLFLSPSLCGRPSPVVSQALSINNSLHLSAAAEPEPHPHACQSPLHAFNPSYPSLCKAALLAPPLSFLLSKQPPSTEAPRSSFNYCSLCRDVIQMHTHINAHAKTNGRAETAALQLVHGGIHCLFASFCHAI